MIMINKTMTLATFGIVVSMGVQAQTIEDGIKALYNGRYTTAKNAFQKNISKPEGTYWLVQTYLTGMPQNKAEAQKVLTAALAAKPNEALLLAAKGQIDLMDKKTAEARQAFEAAVTNAGKKDKAEVLNAVGRAISKVYDNIDKIGDINYAVQVLEEASKIKNKNTWMLADIYTNLGDALRKAKPGDGTAAFGAYQNAVSTDAKFALAYYRMAQIFKSQKNWEVYMENLNKAISADESFIHAYSDYYLYQIGRFDPAGAQPYVDKIIAHSDPDPNNDRYRAQTLWLEKKYDEAINIAKTVVQKAGDNTNPVVYRLLADTYLTTGDTTSAIPYINKFFETVSNDELKPNDFVLKAVALANTPGKEKEVFQSFIDGASAVEDLDEKTDLLKNAADFYAKKQDYTNQANILMKILDFKKNPTINDYFSPGLAYYRAKNYTDSWKIFNDIRTKFSDQNYGYLWSFYNSSIYDTVAPYKTVIEDGNKLIEFSKTDKSEDAKANLFKAAKQLGMIYFNDVSKTIKDNNKAAEYIKLAVDYAPNEEDKKEVQGYFDYITSLIKKGDAKK